MLVFHDVRTWPCSVGLWLEDLLQSPEKSLLMLRSSTVKCDERKSSFMNLFRDGTTFSERKDLLWHGSDGAWIRHALQERVKDLELFLIVSLQCWKVRPVIYIYVYI